MTATQKKSKKDIGALIWRKELHLDFKSDSLESFSRRIQSLPDNKYTSLGLAVTVDNTNIHNGSVKFSIATKSGRIGQACLVGYATQGENIYVTAIAGVEADILFVLLVSIVIVPILFFSITNQNLGSLIFVIFFASLLTGGVVFGAVRTRNRIIKDFMKLLSNN